VSDTGAGLVVGAAIVRAGRLLAAQRADPPELAGRWELPGGKVEPGEGERAAVARECEEELGVRVEAGERIGGDWPVGRGYVMRVYLASIVAGDPVAKEHLALRWLTADQLFDVPWLSPDVPVVRMVYGHLG
jgi:8-oxo-dGTP diphosphatase